MGTVLIKPASEIAVQRMAAEKARVRRAVEAKRAEVLATGFEHAGARWDASDARVQPLTVRLARLAHGRGLPRGRETEPLYDAQGALHELSPSELLDLAEAGDDFRDAVEARRRELLEQIAAAETVADVEAIDVETGWPE